MTNFKPSNLAFCVWFVPSFIRKVFEDPLHILWGLSEFGHVDHSEQYLVHCRHCVLAYCFVKGTEKETHGGSSGWWGKKMTCPEGWRGRQKLDHVGFIRRGAGMWHDTILHLQQWLQLQQLLHWTQHSAAPVTSWLSVAIRISADWNISPLFSEPRAQTQACPMLKTILPLSPISTSEISSSLLF